MDKSTKNHYSKPSQNHFNRLLQTQGLIMIRWRIGAAPNGFYNKNLALNMALEGRNGFMGLLLRGAHYNLYFRL